MNTNSENETSATPVTTENVSLPKWFLADLPEHLPHSIISYAEGEFHWSYDLSRHATVEEAYDYAHKFKDKVQVKLDPSLNGHGGHFAGNTDWDTIFVCDRNENTERSRLLMSHNTEDTVEGYEEEYEKWLTVTTPEYDANPDDFVTAHQWLSAHPAFWVKSGPEKSFHWDTENGLKNMSVNVYLDDDGKTVVFLEHGIHLDDYTGYYHDPRIFALKETFEKSILSMAKKVRKVYGLDGTELPEPASTQE